MTTRRKVILWGLSLIILMIIAKVAYKVVYHRPKSEPIFTIERISANKLAVNVTNTSRHTFEGKLYFVIKNKAWRKSIFTCKPKETYVFNYVGNNSDIDRISLFIEDEDLLFERALPKLKMETPAH